MRGFEYSVESGSAQSPWTPASVRCHRCFILITEYYIGLYYSTFIGGWSCGRPVGLATIHLFKLWIFVSFFLLISEYSVKRKERRVHLSLSVNAAGVHC